MRLAYLTTVSLIFLLAIYYVTVIIHMFIGIFGQNVSVEKSMIPFYGWIKWGSGESGKTTVAKTVTAIALFLAPFTMMSFTNPDPGNQYTRFIYECKDNPNIPCMRVIKFEFDGHKYIKFVSPHNSGFVHDPDCGCHRKKVTPEPQRRDTVVNTFDDMWNF